MFTLGGFLATAWHPSQPLLPWALTSALLTTAAMWGHWTTGRPVDWVVLGLAAYELMMGLLDVDERRSLRRVLAVQRCPHEQQQACRINQP